MITPFLRLYCRPLRVWAVPLLNSVQVVPVGVNVALGVGVNVGVGVGVGEGMLQSMKPEPSRRPPTMASKKNIS
ncbi:MAG: hypothetical protein DME79_00180 [Verrucomicrobia bacterium]|nr:MAG: hypothetical protein DME79_00180 [Verrucomicrobiota bacterium]